MKGIASASTRQVSAAGSASTTTRASSATAEARLGVPLAREQQVPEGVQHGGAERQRQRVERHARDRTIDGCT